jgi:hypothetical protein
MADDDLSKWWDEDAERINKMAIAARKMAVKLPTEKEDRWEEAVEESRAWCPTGPGGGLDNSCGGGGTAAVVREVLKSIEKTGGFSVHPVSAKSPTTGFMCATVPHAEKIFQSSEEITQPAIQSYLDQHKDFLSENPKLHLGGWIDPDTEKVYLDLSEQFEDEASAVAAGIKHNQLAVWDVANKREVRIRRDDNGKRSQAADPVRLPSGGRSEGDRGSVEQGSRRVAGTKESRDCGRGPGGIFGPGNKCQVEGEGEQPSDSFGNPLDAVMRSPSATIGGGGGAKADTSWKKGDGHSHYGQEQLQNAPPARSLSGVNTVAVMNGKTLSASLKETGVTLDQAAKVCGNLSPESNIVIAHGDLKEITEWMGDPSLASEPKASVTVVSKQPVGGVEDAVGTAATLTRTEDDELLLSYSMFSVAPEAQRDNPIAVARGLYSGVVKSITEAEKIGVDEVGMYAAGSDGNDEFKGYRIWPRLGFDGIIPRNRITPTYSLRLGFFERYGSNLPDDILSDKAKQEKSEGALTIQSLYETREGQRWWEENGGPMGMSLRVGDDEDIGWQRFKRISERVSDRDILDALDIEWRSIREERAFCPTGEGQGVDNSCGSGSGASSASVDNSWKKAGRDYLYEPGDGKSPIVGGDDIKSLSIEGPKDVASAMKTLKIKSLTDVVAIGGGLTRGSFTSIATRSDEIHVMSEVPVDPDNEESGSMSSTISIGVDPEGKKFVDYGTMSAVSESGTANFSGEDAARMSSILLEKFPESLAAAEKSGCDYAQTYAMGSSDDEFKGYRLWPQFGFDAELYPDIRENVPKDIIPHDDPVTIQELISTPAGKKWWNENGESMAMTLNLKDKKSEGYKRYKQAIKIAERLKKRNEGRSLYDYLMSEDRGFCPTGEGGGIDNSCGGSSGVNMAPDRDMGSSIATGRVGAGKPEIIQVESQESLGAASSVLGIGGVDDAVTLGGGNVRGAKVDVYADPSGFMKVSSIWPVDADDEASGEVFTEVSMANTSDGKVLGFEAFGPTQGSVATGANQQKVMSIISEKVAESIDAAEKKGFVAVTTFAVGDAKNQYKGYRLWPQFGFDADLPRDLAKRVPPEIVLKAKGIDVPPPGSTSIPHHLVVKSLASQHRDLTIQELISTRDGDRWWDQHGDDIELKLDLTDKSSLGYKKWSEMKDRLPRLRARNETRSFFDSLVEERDADCGRTPDGKFGSNNKCQEDGEGATTATATSGSSGVEEPASGSSQWKTGDAIPDAFQAVSSAKPVSRDESGDITTEVFDRADISPFAGQQFVSPIACGRYLAEMTAQTRGEAIDSKKPLSEESMSFMVESMVQQVESAESRGYTPAFYSDQERQAQLEAYAKIHPILRGGRTASGLCIGQEDAEGNCVQGDSITTEGEFLFRAVQAMTSPQASPLPNMQRADEVLTNFFENPDADKAALGAGSVAGNASKVAKTNLARLQKIIDKVGLTETANIFSQPPVRAGDLDDFFEEKLGLKGFKAGGYAVDQVVPMFSVFGPKVGPFFANNNGDHEALTADVWFSRTWGRLTGELVQETNPKLAKDHADVLSRRMRYVTDEDLQGTSREDFTSSVEQMEKTGEIPASVAAWAEARSKRYGKEGFNKGVKGVRDKEVARLSIAILNNLVSTLDDPGTTVRRSNMIDVISEVSRRTGHPPAFVQDLLWQDEQDIWAAAGARTSTDVGEASLYSTGIDKMVANPMMRFPVKKAAEAEKKKSKASKARKRSIDVESRDYEDDIDSGRGWLEQISFDTETEDVSPEEFADAFIEFASSLPRGDDSEDRSSLESARDAVVELRSAGLTTIVMPNAGREGLHVMGFDADIPKDIAETLPETLSHCKTLLDLHVSSEGRSWWEQNGRDIDVAIDLEGVQGQVFDGFATGKTFSDIIEEGTLDDYGNS